MPATQVWTGGAGDKNFATAGNWVSGVAPVGGDSVVFNNGNAPVDGLATGISVVKATVTANYGGTLGTAASPLTFTAITGSLDYAGTGANAYLGCSGTVANASFTHSGGCNVYLSTGTYTVLTNSTGGLQVAAAVIVAAFNNAGSNNVFIAYNATAITAAIVSGRVTCQRVITTGDVEQSGVLISIDNGTTNYISNGTIIVHGGALYNKQSGVVDTMIDARPGSSVSFAGCSGGATPGTALTPPITKWAGSSVNTFTPGVTITPTYTPRGAVPVGS